TRWSQREIRTSPLVRALQWLDDGTLLTAPYGAGLARGTPGGEDWVDAAHALGWPWLRDVLATEGGAGRWWAVGGRHLYASDDGGETWDVVLTGLALVGDVIAVAPGWPEDARVWTGGVDEDGVGALVASEDGGETWAITPLPGCGDKPSALAADGGTAWVACGSGVWSVDTAGATRVELPAPLADGAVLVLLPTADGLVVGGDGGLWRLGAEAEVLLPSKVRAAAPLAEGWLVSTDRGLVRVTEAGSTPLGWPAGDLVVSLAVEGERIAAGGHTGAWTSDDGGATWALSTDRDRYDDADATWFYEGWEAVAHGSAKRGDAHLGEAGAVAEWRLEATALAVYAWGAGTLAVAVDGGPPEEIQLATGRWTVVWSGAFERAVHTVRIEVLDGRVELDGGERWRADGAVPFPRGELEVDDGPPPQGRACGCGAGGAGAVLLVGVAGLRRRRA
ncbi:MAG: WD40/YVTN/BNR-like repeat-containing protein, partial [Myxococcota bacterium]